VSLVAVVDTNVLISGLFWKGPPFEILKALRDGRFSLALSPAILVEYQRVIEELLRKRQSELVVPMLEFIQSRSLMVTPVVFATTVCDDPDDDKFLEAAIAGKASYVVSGDQALLRLKSYRGVEILRPARFLTLLSAG
jgi:putative PIN family toxin of toxin-antitoxin system